jgi:CheY-like chemotaxis protein
MSPHAVQSGADALAALDSAAKDAQPFRLVVSDVNMPEMDGYAATSTIRKLEREQAATAPTPIIAMTANAMKGDKERCLEAGMDGYVSKPVKRKLLFAEIERVLGIV